MSVHGETKLSAAKRDTEHAAEKAAPIAARLARFGFAAKAVIYMLIGGLSLVAAYGSGGKVTDSTGAMQTIKSQPFGSVLLLMIAVSLAGYALWRLYCAVQGVENERKEAKKQVRRTGYFGSFLIHSSLSFSAFRTILNGGSNSGQAKEQDLTARLLAVPFGRVLVALVGLSIIAVGIYQIIKACKASFVERWERQRLRQYQLKWAKLVSRIGLALQGAVLGLIGCFLINAAWTADPKRTKSIDGALQELAAQPYGQLLFTVAAAGLFLYGVHLLLEAFLRRTYAEEQPADVQANDRTFARRQL